MKVVKELMQGFGAGKRGETDNEGIRNGTNMSTALGIIEIVLWRYSGYYLQHATSRFRNSCNWAASGRK